MTAAAAGIARTSKTQLGTNESEMKFISNAMPNGSATRYAHCSFGETRIARLQEGYSAARITAFFASGSCAGLGKAAAHHGHSFFMRSNARHEAPFCSVARRA